jgi:hypothetical protein
MKQSGQAKQPTPTCAGWRWRRQSVPGRGSQLTVRLKADTTYETTTVRLKADTTYETTTVRLKPDTTYETIYEVGKRALSWSSARIPLLWSTARFSASLETRLMRSG